MFSATLNTSVLSQETIKLSGDYFFWKDNFYSVEYKKGRPINLLSLENDFSLKKIPVKDSDNGVKGRFDFAHYSNESNYLFLGEYFADSYMEVYNFTKSFATLDRLDTQGNVKSAKISVDDALSFLGDFKVVYIRAVFCDAKHLYYFISSMKKNKSTEKGFALIQVNQETMEVEGHHEFEIKGKRIDPTVEGFCEESWEYVGSNDGHLYFTFNKISTDKSSHSFLLKKIDGNNISSTDTREISFNTPDRFVPVHNLRNSRSEDGSVSYFDFNANLGETLPNYFRRDIYRQGMKMNYKIIGERLHCYNLVSGFGNVKPYSSAMSFYTKGIYYATYTLDGERKREENIFFNEVAKGIPEFASGYNRGDINLAVEGDNVYFGLGSAKNKKIHVVELHGNEMKCFELPLTSYNELRNSFLLKFLDVFISNLGWYRDNQMKFPKYFDKVYSTAKFVYFEDEYKSISIFNK
jgi:hypothetical protein